MPPSRERGSHGGWAMQAGHLWGEEWSETLRCSSAFSPAGVGSWTFQPYYLSGIGLGRWANCRWYITVQLAGVQAW